MDEVEAYLRRRWQALGAAGALFTRPWLDLDERSARERLDPQGRLGALGGKRILCLAGGGGQQSAAFALLGAQVTVVDLDEGQLERDRATADHYGLEVDTVRADMRDLTALTDASFDVVYQPYSINFAPHLQAILAGVSRVLGPAGSYVLWLANPFASGVGTRDWTGDGYVVRGPYLDQAVYEFSDEPWVAPSLAGVPPPREYRHTLGTVIGTLADASLFLIALDEHGASPGEAPGGTWQHFKATLPPWFTLWFRRGVR